ncbi:MAG: rRNA maturation RNase YbeY [Bacillota bacterium]
MKATLLSEGRENEADEVSVLFAGDDYIRDLNRRYLGKDEPTDVLSFSMLETTEDEPAVVTAPPVRVLGDVVVSVETAASQASEYGQPLEREVALLVVHGALHLLGYDDCDEAGLERMNAAQQRILAGMGF